MYEELLSTLFSKKDLDVLKQEIELLGGTDYEFGEDGFENVLTDEIREETAQIIRGDLKKNQIPVSEYVKGLSKILEKYHTLELALSFQPRRKNMVNISEWINKNVGELIVVEYRYDPHLLGGAVIVVGGEYRDFSITKMIDRFFDEEKEAVNGALVE